MTSFLEKLCRIGALGAVAAIALAPTTPAHATVPSDLCVGNPCVIDADATIDDGSTLDFGAVDLVVGLDVVLSIGGDGGYAELIADSIVLEAGATIRAETPGESGARLDLTANVGNIEMRVDGGSTSRIELNGSNTGYGGDLTMSASGAGADILLDGVIESTGGEGGSVDIDADGDVRVTDVETTGTKSNSGAGGLIQVAAGADVDVKGRLASRAVGTSGEGADQYVSAGAGIHFHPGSVSDVSSSGAGSVTGILLWDAFGGDILFEGQLIGTTPSSFESTDAAFVYANASGSITIAGTMDMGAGNNGSAYESRFQAGGDITVLPSGWIKAGSRSAGGEGGGLDLEADGHVSVQGDLDISGGGHGTGTISIDAGLAATIESRLKATASSGGSAGSIEIAGCDVIVTSDGKLEVKTGSTGTTALSGGRQVLVFGQVKAGLENTVAYDLNEPELIGSITPAATVSQTADSSGCGGLAACGDGVLDVGEQCDDGNTTDGDCCSSSCAAEAAGNACALDWGLCALNQCDGFGVCGIATPGTSCFGMVGTSSTQLQFNDKSVDKGDLVSLKWLKGDAVPLVALPDPLSGDDVELCVYGPTGQPIFRAAAPGAGTCAGKPCWKASSTGYSYSDKERTPDGILKVLLKSGDELKAKVLLKAKGENVPPLPPLPLSLPVTAQLLASTGTCWEATFASPRVIKNTPEQFKGRAQPPCGDGIVSLGEACDDGNTVDGDYCSANCLEATAICGDSIVGPGEACDDGNTVGGDYCSADCTAETAICGDSVIGPGECCDDGNTTGGDGCEATCDSGILCPPPCDLPPGHYAYCYTGATGCGPCGAGLGDCDYDSQCLPGLRCVSDIGTTFGFPATVDVCVAVTCGDGVTHSPAEACDDGNTSGGDYCAADCSAVTAVCGDSVIGVGETCDDGNLVDGDGCDSNCLVTACGNGIATAGEDCDDGGESATCNADCTTSSCGDGTLNVAAGEGCDDGNTFDGDGCESDCSWPTTCVPGGEWALPGDGTATQCANGLVWEMKTGTVSGGVTLCADAITCPDPHDVNQLYTWSTGDPYDFDGTAKTAFLDLLNDAAGGGTSCFAGHCDWRLPHRDQMQALLDPDFPDCTDPPCTTIPGTNRSSTYLTGSRAPVFADAVYIGRFNNGHVSRYAGNITRNFYVRAVRNTCGNGTIEIGDSCDDGNLIDGDGCDSNCTPTGCGNEIVTAGEQCDDGNSQNGDGCETDCTLTP